MSHHGLCNFHIDIDFSVVNLKIQAHEIGQDCSSAGHSLDWGCILARFRTDDGESMDEQTIRMG